MAIKIYGDRINFGTYELKIGLGGVICQASNGTPAPFSAVQYIDQYSFQGKVYNFGYSSGGIGPPSPPPLNRLAIDRFPFATNSNATQSGNLSAARYYLAGSSSPTHGYSVGGQITSTPSAVIDRFLFSTGASSAANVGSIGAGVQALTGHSSEFFGYVSGGIGPAPTLTYQSSIKKFPYASTNPSINIGNMTAALAYRAGNSSLTHGYDSSGFTGAAMVNTIDRFPFANEGNSTDVGDTTIVSYVSAGQSSSTDGYNSGGITLPNTPTNTISKFPFATNANATDVGDLSVSRYGSGGQSSTTHGYNTGGITAGTFRNEIDRFPFASNANATDVGDLSQLRYGTAGQQY